MPPRLLPIGAALLLVLLAGGGCRRGAPSLEILAPLPGPERAVLQVRVAGPLLAGGFTAELDGVPVTGRLARTSFGFRGTVPVVAGTAHRLVVRARFEAAGGGAPVELRAERIFRIPPPLPDLEGSEPSPGASRVPPDAWIVLHLAAPAEPGALAGLRLACVAGDLLETRVDLRAAALPDGRVVVDPVPALPPGAGCALTWVGPEGSEHLLFSVDRPPAPAPLPYDRRDGRPAPLPDDFFAVDDGDTVTGLRLEPDFPGIAAADRILFDVLLPEVRRLDGWSPIAPIVVPLPFGVDPESLPGDPAASLDPAASVGLFDIDPGSPGYGERVPVRMELRDDATFRGIREASLILFPSVPLRPEGRYGLVVTRRVRLRSGAPLGPSPFFAAALGPPEAGEDPSVSRARDLVAEVADAVEHHAAVPLAREDLALALRITVRSTDRLADDLLAVRRFLADRPPPQVHLATCRPDPDPDVAAIVEGTFTAPDWRDEAGFLRRDPDGWLVTDPAVVAGRELPFVLALPAAAEAGPVPLVIYQHGNPGSAEDEVPGQARGSLGAAGFAVAGFTDVLNRELSPGAADPDAAITAQILAVFTSLLAHADVLDAWVQTNADQLAFLRAMGVLDAALAEAGPFGSCRRTWRIDAGAPVGYLGVSQGANHAPALLPYAPELGAAVLVAGGARLAEVLMHQQASVFTQALGSFFPTLGPTDIWSALSLFQQVFDDQDAHNHARFLIREPLAVPLFGAPPGAPWSAAVPSVLLVEGLDDSLVPNHATESLAWALGTPHLAPVQRPVPFLPVVRGPVSGNREDGGTAAFYQYVPRGVSGIPPTPGCIPPAVSPATADEGHFCAQSAAEAVRQRVRFLRSAVDEPAPVAEDPLAGP